jgi:hypothetical protein
VKVGNPTCRVDNGAGSVPDPLPDSSARHLSGNPETKWPSPAETPANRYSFPLNSNGLTKRARAGEHARNIFYKKLPRGERCISAWPARRGHRRIPKFGPSPPALVRREEMSALPPKAAGERTLMDVAKVPDSDIHPIHTVNQGTGYGCSGTGESTLMAAPPFSPG